MGIPSSVLRFAALGAAVLAWFVAAPHLPGLSLWWDIVLVSFVVMPATLLLVLWALPLWNRRWLPVGAGVLALAAFGFAEAGWGLPENFAKLFAAVFAGWAFLILFERLSWVVIVAPLLHQLPEAFCVTGDDPIDPPAVARGDVKHQPLIGVSGEWIAIAPAHMSHVDAQHPEQPAALARRQIAEGAEEAAYIFVVFRRAALVNTASERAAQDRQNADIRTVAVLQEQHLELDGVLDGVTVILHDDRAGGFA